METFNYSRCEELVQTLNDHLKQKAGRINKMGNKKNIETKKYNVTAAYNKYVSEEFDSLDEALARVVILSREGYATVSVRDTEVDRDIW